MRDRRRTFNPERVIRRHSREADVLRGLRARLTATQHRRLRAACRRLDRAFVLEKAELLKDTVLEIVETRSGRRNRLLQRSVWSSLDALALHMDSTGLTRVFQEVAPRLFRSTPLDDPGIVALEWHLLLDYLGVSPRRAAKLGLPFEGVQSLIRLAEAEKSDTKCGLPKISRKGFSFREVMANCCGRPDKILETYHNPVSKIVGLIVIEVINVIAGIAGALTAAVVVGWLGIALFVVSTIIVIVIACKGC